MVTTSHGITQLPPPLRASAKALEKLSARLRVRVEPLADTEEAAALTAHWLFCSTALPRSDRGLPRRGSVIREIEGIRRTIVSR